MTYRFCDVSTGGHPSPSSASTLLPPRLFSTVEEIQRHDRRRYIGFVSYFDLDNPISTNTQTISHRYIVITGNRPDCVTYDANRNQNESRYTTTLPDSAYHHIRMLSRVCHVPNLPLILLYCECT